jgi:TRAP transporter TAXI family solute receptor
MVDMTGKRLTALVCTAVLLLGIAGCGKTSDGPSGGLSVLTIGTADSGGTMYPVGSAIAETLSSDTRKINVSASYGSYMNIRNLASGEIDLGLVSGDTAYDAYCDPEGSGSSLRAIAAVFNSASTWVAPVSTGATYVHDIKDLRIGVGPEGSTTECSAQAAIQALGLDETETQVFNCGLGAGTDLVLAGELDAIHGFAGQPISAFTKLTQQSSCRVLQYTEEELDRILASNPYFTPAVVPAGTYEGQTEDVATFGAKCLLCVNADMDEELVYELTKALWEARDTLTQAHPAMKDMEDGQFLYQDLSIPLHPGAQRFYEELAAAQTS